MVDLDTTLEMWDVLGELVAVQKAGDKVTAEEVYAELMEYMEMEEITLPALFQGTVPFELFEIFVEDGAVFITNSYPNDSPEKHTHPVFIECGSTLPQKIVDAYPGLGDMFTKRFCSESADAHEEETESDPTEPYEAGEGIVLNEPDDPSKPYSQAEADAELYTHIDLKCESASAVGWILSQSAIEGGTIDMGDGRNWFVERVYPFVLTGLQMKRLPPPGYISDSIH